MITPFLIKMKNNKYIFLKEDRVELYNEFPLEGDLRIIEESDKFRVFAHSINLNMPSLIFIRSLNQSCINNKLKELLDNGSSSIMKIIIDLDNESEFQKTIRKIYELKKSIILQRGINYGMILFYLRVKNANFIPFYKKHINNNISMINYNYDYNVIPSNSFCNWVICSDVKYVKKLSSNNPDAYYIFDISNMLKDNRVQEIVYILKHIITKLNKRKIRLFPMSANRLFLHRNLENYCSCKEGKNICCITKEKTLFTCNSEIPKFESYTCLNCVLKEICGSCAVGILNDGTCSIKSLFNKYYSEILHCEIEC